MEPISNKATNEEMQEWNSSKELPSLLRRDRMTHIEPLQKWGITVGWWIAQHMGCS